MQYSRKSHTSFPCPCCGFHTLSHKADWTFEICEVCYWEDDIVQLNDIDFEWWANEVSLRQARINFINFWASDKKLISYTRKPRKYEFPH